MQDCNPCTWEVEAGDSEVQGHIQLYRKPKATLSFLRPCVTKYLKHSDLGELELDSWGM